MEDETKKIIARLVSRFLKKESALLPVLTLLQKENGYISEDNMRYISKILNISEARVFSTTSFYSLLSLQSGGKYNIQVCTNIVCSILDDETLFDYVSKTLGIKEGEITPDGLFSITAVECLAACGYAPAMQINMEHYENMTFEKVDEIIDSIRKKEGT
jgi:NADH-quinone oxidoreductase E subunit